MDNTLIPNDRERMKIYVANHYRRNYNVKIIHDELSKIPSDVIVSAQSPYLAHLALRDKIYQFPIIKDAEVIVYSFNEQPYPLSKDEFKQFTDDLIHSGKWKIQFEGEGVIILHKVL
jgi:folate-dependent tRNA-U54 methylase TrmFO/GidA